MDAVVQLIRNGLCCIKDLDWFHETFPELYDPLVVRQYVYDLPEPHNETTPLEALIGASQFYAFYSNTLGGWTLTHTSYGKLVRVQRLLDQFAANHPKTEQLTDAQRLVRASLIKEANMALRSLFVGILVMSIGISFLWLVGNSFHATQSGIIGGLPALIHALTVMEVALVPLLYYMIIDAQEQFAQAQKMDKAAKALQEGVGINNNMELCVYEGLTGWIPFWDQGVSAFDMTPVPDSAVEEKQVAQEVQALQERLREFSSSSDKSKNTLPDQAATLIATSRVKKWEGYREYLYFILNFIAFYGYAVGVVVYYYADVNEQPPAIVAFLGYMENDLADWWGNFAGDFMWTIEPIFILYTPILFQRMKDQRQAAAKLKAE